MLNKLKDVNFLLTTTIIIAALLLYTLDFLSLKISNLHSGNPNSHNYWVYSEVFSNKDYARRLYTENKNNSSTFVPFLHWKGKQRSSDLINVDSEGYRLTIGNSTNPKAVKIFFFGGSTTWGIGAEDKDTIPSLLTQELNKAGVYNVTNYGQGGYFSTQEAIAFIFEILKEKKPDIAIFLDGFNENWVGGYSPGDFFKYSGYDPKKDLKIDFSNNAAVLNLIWRNSYLYKTFQYYGLIPSTEEIYDVKNQSRLDPKTNGKKVTESYIRCANLIHNVGNSYGIKTMFFWQPTILSGSKKELSLRERGTMNDSSQTFRKIVYESYKYMDSVKLPSHIINISHCLDNVTLPLYIDHCHTGLTGNKLIADKIMTEVLRATPSASK